MNVEILKQMKPILNIRNLCNLAKLNYQTIFAKITFNRELDVKEAGKISEVLKEHKLEEGE
jgi:hypothetical protein